MSKNNIPHKNGFTLIEVIIAILIVAIIPSITILSVNKARSKSQNNAIELILASLPIEIQKSFDRRGTLGVPYAAVPGNLCSSTSQTSLVAAPGNDISVFHDPEIRKIIQSASIKSGGLVRPNSLLSRAVCRSDNSGPDGNALKWVVTITAKGDEGAYCIDSTTNKVKFVNFSGLGSIYPDTPSQAMLIPAYTCR